MSFSIKCVYHHHHYFQHLHFILLWNLFQNQHHLDVGYITIPLAWSLGIWWFWYYEMIVMMMIEIMSTITITITIKTDDVLDRLGHNQLQLNHSQHFAHSTTILLRSSLLPSPSSLSLCSHHHSPHPRHHQYHHCHAVIMMFIMLIS